MKYHFQCVLTGRDFPERNGSIQALDHTEYNHVCGVMDGSVYQLHADGRRSRIAELQNINYLLNDFTTTYILYNNGCLSCTTNYDLCCPNAYSYRQERAEAVFTVHIKFGEEYPFVLEYEGVNYPIRRKKDEVSKIKEILVYRPAAADLVPLARIVCADRRENQMVYDIRTDYIPYPVLCVAICSLPIIL